MYILISLMMVIVPGVAYLVFLGIKSIRNKSTFSIEIDDSENSKEWSKLSINQYKTYFFQGFLSDFLNPKTVIVYMTLMPQFINTDKNVYLQLIILGVILIVEAILWFLMIVYILKYIRSWFKEAKVQNIFNKVAGTMLVSLAIKLAL